MLLQLLNNLFRRPPAASKPAGNPAVVALLDRAQACREESRMT
jgi:hypothetical protein